MEEKFIIFLKGGIYNEKKNVACFDLKENLYEDYLPQDYNREDVITYQWNQTREHNLQGQFNFYYNITKNSISRGSMFLYMVLLIAIGIIGDVLANYVMILIDFLT